MDMSIKRKRRSINLERAATEIVRREYIKIKPLKIQHVMIKCKPAGKLTKYKKLRIRIKHIRTGQIVVRMSIIYENIE